MKKVTIQRKDPYGTGIDYGQQLHNEISRCIDYYIRITEYQKNIPAKKYIEEAIDVTKKSFPNVHEEMRGIADAVDRSIEYIYLINCRSEIMNLEAWDIPGECTVVYIEKDGVIGQTWDWSKGANEFIVDVTFIYSNKTEIRTILEAGELCKIGKNSRGLCLCKNFLYYPLDNVGIPTGLLHRIILESNNIETAIGKVKKLKLGCAVTFSVLDINNRFCCFEIRGKDVEIIRVNDYFVHTNHYLTTYFDPKPALPADTYMRFAKSKEIISQNIRSLNGIDLVRKVLGHQGVECAIKKESVYNKQLDDDMQTVRTIIMKPDQDYFEVY